MHRGRTDLWDRENPASVMATAARRRGQEGDLLTPKCLLKGQAAWLLAIACPQDWAGTPWSSSSSPKLFCTALRRGSGSETARACFRRETRATLPTHLLWNLMKRRGRSRNSCWCPRGYKEHRHVPLVEMKRRRGCLPPGQLPSTLVAQSTALAT